MPPKVTDTRTAQNEALHQVEAETAAGARQIVATFSDDFHDCVTLMCMLGVEPEGLSYKKVHEEHLEATAKKTTAKKTTAKKATAKKAAAKKTTKKA